MGIFGNSDSSVLFRRSSQLLHPVDATITSSHQAGLESSSTQGSGIENLTSRPCTSQSCNHTNNEVYKRCEMMGSGEDIDIKVDLSAPTIPLRTSSKDAASVSSLARSLVSKGKKLKRSASKLSLVSNMSTSTVRSTASKDVDNKKVTCQHPNNKAKARGQTTSSISPTNGKLTLNQLDVGSSTISNPSHFRHLTHALPQQFTKIASASHSDLVADFSVMRASQNSSRNFRGIKTVDLHSRNSSAETNSASLTSSEACSSISSATLSLASGSSRNSTQNLEPFPQSRCHDIHSKRSHESFSQPFSYRPALKPSIAAPLPPPPRISSRRASTHYEQATLVEESHDTFSEATPTLATFEESGSENLRQSLGRASDPVELDETPAQIMDRTPFTYGCSLPSVDEEEVVLRSPSGSTGASLVSHPENGSRQLSNTKGGRSMQRSSLNNGLFTSWSFEEEPPHNPGVNDVEQGPRVSPAPAAPQSSPATPNTKVIQCSRIPVRSTVPSKSAASHRRIMSS